MNRISKHYEPREPAPFTVDEAQEVYGAGVQDGYRAGYQDGKVEGRHQMRAEITAGTIVAVFVAAVVVLVWEVWR